jgi:hypothetical protein
MNVQPVNLNTLKTDYKSKGKVAFAGYSSSIDKEALTITLRKVRANWKDEKIQARVGNWLKILERMKQTYSADRFIDVCTFIRGEDVWATISLAPGRVLKNFIDFQITQSITDKSCRIEITANSFASTARNQLTRGLRAV